MTYIDSLGNDVNVGDYVVFIDSSTPAFFYGRVISHNLENVKIQPLEHIPDGNRNFSYGSRWADMDSAQKPFQTYHKRTIKVEALSKNILEAHWTPVGYD